VISPRVDEHREAAAHAGLSYVTDGLAGIRRERTARAGAITHPAARSSPIRREKTHPGAGDPSGMDRRLDLPRPRRPHPGDCARRRGRKQYRYHPLYRDTRDKSKFRRMLEFSEILPEIRERVERDLRARDLTRRQILATVVMLLDKTLIRVGNDEYARDNRLVRPHDPARAARRGERREAALLLPRQERRRHAISIHDRRLARIVQQCQDLPGYELFKYIDESGKRQTISSDDVNAYLREITGRDITAKDFRNLGGTMLAARALFALGPAKTQREAERNMIRAIDAVGEAPGNTAAVCRKYYVHPGLVRTYLQASPRPSARNRSRSRRGRKHDAALRRDEVAVLQFLQEDAGSGVTPMRRFLLLTLAPMFFSGCILQ